MRSRGTINRPRSILCAFVILGASLFAGSGIAQTEGGLGMGPPVTSREAFASPYGRALINALSAVLERAADPACAANRTVSPNDWQGRAETLLVRHGQAHFDRMAALVDRQRAEDGFRDRAGPDAIGEMRRLRTDPAVAALIETIRARQSIDLAEDTAQIFDRYVMLAQIPLARFSPLSTGAEELLRLREELDEATLDAFEAQIRTNDTPSVRRFIELIESADDAVAAAIDPERLASTGPMQSVAGLDRDLRDYCIGAR